MMLYYGYGTSPILCRNQFSTERSDVALPMDSPSLPYRVLVSIGQRVKWVSMQAISILATVSGMTYLGAKLNLGHDLTIIRAALSAQTMYPPFQY